MLCPKNANGSSRWASMESHSAATSSAMVFRRGVRIGTTTTDRGRDSAQALYAAPPPPGGRKQKGPRRPCRNVPGAGDPAQPQRQEFAAIRGEAIHRIAVAGVWWLVTGGCATSIGDR